MSAVDLSQLPSDAEIEQGKRLAVAFTKLCGADAPRPSQKAVMTALFIAAGSFVKATGPGGPQLEHRLRQMVRGIEMFARDE